MEEELLTHLTNLLRHSHIVTFKIPSVLFKEEDEHYKMTPKAQKKHKEIEDAWTYIKNDMDLQIYKHQQEENLITVRVKVKHTKGVL